MEQKIQTQERSNNCKKRNRVFKKFENCKSQVSIEKSIEKKVYYKKSKKKKIESTETLYNINPDSNFSHKCDFPSVPSFHFTPTANCSKQDLKNNTVVSYICMEDILPQNAVSIEFRNLDNGYKKLNQGVTEDEKVNPSALTVLKSNLCSTIPHDTTCTAIIESGQTKQNTNDAQRFEKVVGQRGSFDETCQRGPFDETLNDPMIEYNFLDDAGIHNESFNELNLEYYKKGYEKIQLESKQQKKEMNDLENKHHTTLDKMTDVLNSLNQLNRDILEREHRLRGLEQKMALEKRHFENEKYMFYQKSTELKYELERNRFTTEELVKLDCEQKMLVKEKDCIQKLKYSLDVEKFRLATEKELIKKQFLAIQNILVTDNELLFVIELNKSNISYRIQLSDLNNVFKILVTRENFSKLMNNFYRCFVNKTIMRFTENNTTYMLTYTPAINFKFMILVIQAEKVLTEKKSEKSIPEQDSEFEISTIYMVPNSS